MSDMNTCCSSAHTPADTACRNFERGQNGRCAYCDHEEKCHPGPGATCEIGSGENGPGEVEDFIDRQGEVVSALASAKCAEAERDECLATGPGLGERIKVRVLAASEREHADMVLADYELKCMSEKIGQSAEDRVATLAILKASREHCGTCRGKGGVDSGAPTPWGTYPELPCPECSGREVLHSRLGPCIVSAMCLELQRRNGDHSSMFVFHDGDIKEVSKHFILEREFNRASGDCICDWCKKKYYDHPRYEREEWRSMMAEDSDHPSYPLRQLCDGSLVKL